MTRDKPKNACQENGGAPFCPLFFGREMILRDFDLRLMLIFNEDDTVFIVDSVCSGP